MGYKQLAKKKKEVEDRKNTPGSKSKAKKFELPIDNDNTVEPIKMVDEKSV